ncbi:unnamed protein product [Rangifer tarandus platyrhynchus]|uniref:Uncharacterized protein n=2 Tax=Rangifer tarandus platyrhynchus TaxID=3082113 RepID=A0AC59ZSV3_RANTA|nr:unnamed protein product [Rangifer tarandus platyrhynchus]
MSSFHQDEAEAPHTRGKAPVMSSTLRITCQSPCHVIDLKNHTHEACPWVLKTLVMFRGSLRVSHQEEGDYFSTRCSSGFYLVPVLTPVFHLALVVGFQNAQGRDLFKRVLG